MVEWHWDRLNVQTGTSAGWAAHNCTGSDGTTPQVHRTMQHQIQQQQKHIEVEVTAEIHELLRSAAEITGMTYKCKYRVRREQFGDWKDLKQTTPRPEPKWKPCSASTLPDSPCDNGGVDDPFALDAMVIHGHPVMACNDDIWDCNMKVS
jgi:hypothetical protein